MAEGRRIFYVGPLGLGSTTLQRMEAMRQLGLEIIPFDKNPYFLAGSRLQRSLTQRLAWGPGLWRLNADLAKAAGGVSCDWVWIDKGTWIYPETVEALRKATGGLMVHYTPDPAISFHRTRHFMRSIPRYDVLITSKPWEVEAYKRLGAKRVIMLPQGFDPALFHPYELTAAERAELGSRVCFIGHYERHYRRCVQAAAGALGNGDVAAWGMGWMRQRPIRPGLRNVIRGEGVWHERYAKAICAADIGLGLLSKWIPETATTRTFEIPACGTFLLAERTEEHQGFFREGVEAEFFSGRDEMVDKIKFYLAHPAERGRIAAAGRERCLRGGYSYFERMRQCVGAIEEGKGDFAVR